MKTILLTGMAGFIGYHLAKELLSNGFKVIGIDNISNSYDIKLKFDRLEELGFYTKNLIDNKVINSLNLDNLSFIKADICNSELLNNLFNSNDIDIVINLASYVGVRDSVENPSFYIQSNLVGFSTLIEIAAKNNIEHFIYASSSSVYGYTEEPYLEESQSCEKPLNLYAATKKSNELIAHVYSNIYNMPTTGLRFFNVYGEFGRPDMAPFIFTDSIYNEKIFTLNNKGEMYRDLVYVGDIVKSIRKLTTVPPKIKKGKTTLKNSNICPYRVVNIGNSRSIKLIDFVSIIENNLGKKANFIQGEAHKGEALVTLANPSFLEEITNFKPSISFEEGIQKYINWYLKYYQGK